jgi:hypothetical protein
MGDVFTLLKWQSTLEDLAWCWRSELVRVVLLTEVSSSQSHCQYVLVSSPLCGCLTKCCFLSSVWVWNVLSCLCGEPSLTRGLSFVSHSLVICLCVYLLFTFLSFTTLPHTYIYIYTYIHYTIHIIHTRSLLVPARYSKLCPITH